MLLEWIALARSWHLIVRIGMATIAVAAATALQLPFERGIPGEPFLYNFAAVVVSATALGRIPGYLAVVETSIASLLYLEPVYSVKVSRSIDLVSLGIYLVLAAFTVEAFCRLIDSALAEKSEAYLARSQLQEVQARLAAIVTSSFDAIVSKTLDGLITSWNEAAERLFGYGAGEILGQSIRRLIPADRQAEEDRILATIARGECIENYDTVRITKDGRPINVSVTISPVRGVGGRIKGASKIAHDITERKRTEALLVERERQLALFIEHAPVAIAMFDSEMRFLAVSRRFLSDYRLPARSEVIGHSYYEILPEVPRRWRELHARVLTGEELGHEEDPFPHWDGHIDRVQWSMRPWHTADGRIGGAVLFSQFMTGILAQREARFQATFENAAVGIAHIAPDGRWLRVNRALCRILGYSVDELVTRSFQDVTHPDDLAADLAQVWLMREGKIDSYGVEKRYLRGDGSIIWGRNTVGCVRKEDKSVDYFVSVVEDITARRAYEEHFHLLMREVNHRAKNMLSLVLSIARQTAARDPGDFIERFAGRVQALAANQDLLVRNDWQGVDVEELVCAQLEHFADLVGSRIAVGGPSLRLNAAAAQAIGLALHELATNAGKYGALSVDAGRVDVSWGTEGNTFTMNWTEGDGPPVSPPKRRGFGTVVMTAIAERDVGGEVALDYAPPGVTWRLTCPATNVLEPYFQYVENRADR
jgi:PAS domain S-box-containing protein